MLFSGLFFSHSWGVPTMKITDRSILCKWENLKNRQCIEYLFASLNMIAYLQGLKFGVRSGVLRTVPQVPRSV